MDTVNTQRRKGALGVHSVNRFVFTVPDLDEAERFYAAFGLDTRRKGNQLDLHTFGHTHCWGSVIANGQPKKLQYLSFGIYEEDRAAFEQRARQRGAVEAHPLSDGSGVWLTDGDGTPVQIVVAPKVSPSVKSPPTPQPEIAAGKPASHGRKAAPHVHPRHLSHILLFTPDVARQIEFYTQVLGLRLSDQSSDIVAFMHGAHASDHHLVALAKSEARGLHHSSWDVGSLHEVGLGAEQMRDRGYTRGWGLGRHVLGSNYFYYVRDPWGSYAEYSFDIDFIPVDVDWPAANHPPEDSFYVWGPPVPDEFIVNYEAAGRSSPA